MLENDNTGNIHTVALLQQIYSQLRNVYCVSNDLSYMKELQQLIDTMKGDNAP